MALIKTRTHARRTNERTSDAGRLNTTLFITVALIRRPKGSVRPSASVVKHRVAVTHARGFVEGEEGDGAALFRKYQFISENMDNTTGLKNRVSRKR